MIVCWPLGAHLKDTAQNGLPELPREPPGSCRGPFREAQEGPKRRQGRPKTAPRAAKSAPKASQRRSQSGLGGPTWPQRAPRRAPGDDVCPPRGSIVGSCGARFWLLPALLGDRFPHRQTTGPRAKKRRPQSHQASRI